jgi:hypothetical protein
VASVNKMTYRTTPEAIIAIVIPVILPLPDYTHFADLLFILSILAGMLVKGSYNWTVVKWRWVRKRDLVTTGVSCIEADGVL